MSQAPGRDGSSVSYSRPKLRNQLLFLFGILALAGGAFYTALVVATQVDHIFFPGSEIRLAGLPSLPGIDAQGTSSQQEIGGGRINILVMGLDKRPSDGDVPARTDTMFVMTIDPSTHTARGLAMPRDLWVDIPSKSGNSSFKQRINTAYVFGETNGYNGGGPGLAKQVVEKLLDIKINYYAVIDFEGFKQVIDLLGGIEVDVPAPGVNDPYYSETERLGDYYPCVFPPGMYHMNGSQALCYSRVRNGSSDLDRILRQQRVIFAVMDKATQLNVLANVDNVPALWKRYKNLVDTDISDFQIPGFARLASSIDTDQLAFLSIGAATTPYTTEDGAAVLLPSAAGIKQIRDAFVSDSRLISENAVVEVQNGTGVPGQAQDAAEYFTSLGIAADHISAVNATTIGNTRTQIIDFTGKVYTAERLANWLSLGKDRVRVATPEDAPLRTTTADIVVILGTDAKIESALASPR